jgi:transposase-like protein/IS1 family transposase
MVGAFSSCDRMPMLDFAHITNIFLLVVVILLLRPHLRRWHKHLHKRWKTFKQRQWKPASPHDCDRCCHQVGLQVIKQRDVIPYYQTQSPRGRRKLVATRGYACPNPNCTYCGITDDTIHALVGYGRHNRIQRFKCQACGKVFTSRIGTPLYYLKTSPERVEMVLWFLAEGVDVSVMVRFTGGCDATIARWLERMGSHSQAWHNHLFRDLVFVVLQLDELYTRVRGIASARWLWLAIDPVSKVIPSLHIGGRSKDDAFALAHDIKIRLRSGHVPAFLTDGLRTYFYAITAHFGRWFRPARARKDHWQPSDQLHHGMLIKRKHKNRKTITQTRMAYGQRCDLFDKLQAVGLRRLIQTAFIERVNLTFRQGVSALSRRTWAYAQSDQHLLMHCEWFRLYYHLVRAHESLRVPVPGLKRRYRQRTPAMALGLTDHIWELKDLLHYPVPQAA